MTRDELQKELDELLARWPADADDDKWEGAADRIRAKIAVLDAPDRFCKDDEIWVCGACGKTSESDSYGFTDSSCAMHAVRCVRASVKYGRALRVTDATAVQVIAPVV